LIREDDIAIFACGERSVLKRLATPDKFFRMLLAKYHQPFANAILYFYEAGTFNPGVSTISGLVIAVHLTNVPGNDGTIVLVTVVTLQQNPGFASSTFCGNVADQFPLNSFARVDFAPGTSCSTILVIVLN